MKNGMDGISSRTAKRTQAAERLRLMSDFVTHADCSSDDEYAFLDNCAEFSGLRTTRVFYDDLPFCVVSFCPVASDALCSDASGKSRIRSAVSRERLNLG